MNKTAPKDTELFQIIEAEEKKQQGTINLTASENYVSGDVRHAQASVLMNKYAEGYPGKRRLWRLNGPRSCSMLSISMYNLTAAARLTWPFISRCFNREIRSWGCR